MGKEKEEIENMEKEIVEKKVRIIEEIKKVEVIPSYNT